MATLFSKVLEEYFDAKGYSKFLIQLKEGLLRFRDLKNLELLKK